MEHGEATSTAPTDDELERAIASVPGVVDASVNRVGGSERSRLRIRLAPGEDAEAVSWAVAATLRERFGIPLDPDAIRPLTSEHAIGEEPAHDPIRLVETPSTPEQDEDVDDVNHDRTDATQHLADTATTAGAAAAEGAASAGAAAEDLRRTRDRLSAAAEAALVSLHGGTRRGRGGQAADTGPVAGSAEASDPQQAPAAAQRPAAAFFGAVEPPEPPAPSMEEERIMAEQDASVPTADLDASAADGTESDVGATRTVGTEHRASRLRARPAIRNLDTQRDEHNVRVTATLEHDGHPAHGSAVAVPTSQGILRAVAEATVAALRQLTGDALLVGVDRISLQPVAEPASVTVVVTLLTDRGEETLLGASIVRGDPEQAVMRATLDALNRRVLPLVAGAGPTLADA